MGGTYAVQNEWLQYHATIQTAINCGAHLHKHKSMLQHMLHTVG